MTKAWAFPDPLQTRFLMLSFDSPPITSWSTVVIVELEWASPTSPALHDYQPSLWVVGNNISSPAATNTQPGIGTDSALLPRIPRGFMFTAIKFSTEGTPNPVGFTEEPSG